MLLPSSTNLQALLHTLLHIVVSVLADKVTFFVQAEDQPKALDKFNLLDRASSVLSSVLHSIGWLVGSCFTCMSITQNLLLVDITITGVLHTRPVLLDGFDDIGYELIPVEMLVPIDIDFFEETVE